MKKLVLLMAMAILVGSCTKTEKGDVSTGQSTTQDSTQDSTVQPTQQNSPATAQDISPMIPSAAPSTTAPGMNPPHGEPGHRCDIPVGAPLNLPVSAKNNVPAQIQNFVPVQNSTAVQTAPGMNPPHGEPGHRCEIPVGAPLSSAPATVSTPLAPAP